MASPKATGTCVSHKARKKNEKRKVEGRQAEGREEENKGKRERAERRNRRGKVKASMRKTEAKHFPKKTGKSL